MGREQSKSAKRRFNDGKFHNQYFVGRGVDIGAGKDSVAQYVKVFRGIVDVDSWDVPNGDAQYMKTVSDGVYDFVHSSHCLEHMVDPAVALLNWIRITKIGGHLIITIPDAHLYERDKWPSRFNGDHKWRFTTDNRFKGTNVINVLDLLSKQPIIVKRIELIDDFFDDDIEGDQTRLPNTECSIEIILQKVGHV